MASEAFAGVGTKFQRWNGASWDDIAEVNSIDGPGMTKDVLEVTSLETDAGYNEFITGFAEGGTLTLDMNFTRETYELMKEDFESDDVRSYRIVLPDYDSEPSTFTIEGLVIELPITMTADDKVTADVVIQITSQVVLEEDSWSSYWTTRAAFYQGEWDFVNNKLLDRTDNGNDFDIGNSYCINPNDVAVDAVLKSAITIDITAPFSVTFEVFKEAAVNSGIICGGGNTLQDYIYLLNDKIWLASAASGNVEFAVNATVGQWDRISITGDGTNVTVTNVTTSQTQTKARGSLAAIICPRILGRGGSGALIHPIRYLNINDQYEWHFSEYPTTGGTKTPKFYDVIGGNHATPGATAHLQAKLDSGRHWNLRYGYSIWENGTGGIVWVPYGKDGNPLTLTVGTDIATGYAKTFDCPPHVSRHNGCETTIKAPAALLTYDVDNFMFDESDVAKEIAFENVAENRGNQIFANKTVENYYYELVVLKQPEV